MQTLLVDAAPIDKYFADAHANNEDEIMSRCSDDSFDFAQDVRYRERFIGHLSPDIVFVICQFLSVHTLTLKVSKVCTLWQRIADQAMHYHVERMFPGFLQQNTPVPFNTMPTLAEMYASRYNDALKSTLALSKLHSSWHIYDNYWECRLEDFRKYFTQQVPIKYIEPNDFEKEEIEYWVDTHDVFGMADNCRTFDEEEDLDRDLLNDGCDDDALLGEEDGEEMQDYAEFVKSNPQNIESSEGLQSPTGFVKGTKLLAENKAK